MITAWALTSILYSIYLVWKDGNADDSGVVMYWSGLFITLAWATFIIYPLNRLDHSREIFKPKIFLLITAIYGALAYSILVGGIFRSFDLVIMFLPLATLIGLFFGLTYSLLIKSDKLVDLLFKRPSTKIIFFLSPAIFLFIYLWLLPTIAPAAMFRFTTDEVRTKIIRQTIPEFKVGDNIEPLKNSLPGYLDHITNGKGNMSASMEDFAFVIQVNCGKIIRLEYGNDQKDFDGNIYGKLEEQPCN